MPANNVIPLPGGLALDEAAMIEAASTPFHALTKRAPVQAGDAVAVVGVGGLGFHSVAIARMLGAVTVVAVDVSEEALERARRHGATHAFNANDSGVGRAIRDGTGGGVHVAAECVGHADTYRLSIEALRPGGVAVLIGIGPEPVIAPPTTRFAVQELEVRGAFAYSRLQTERVIQLVAAGRLDVRSAISEKYWLEEIGDAVENFRSKTSNPVRVLVMPRPDYAA